MEVNLKKFRLQNNLTQLQAAELLGISLSYVKKIEAGERLVSLRMANLIADSFGCSSINEILIIS